MTLDCKALHCAGLLVVVWLLQGLAYPSVACAEIVPPRGKVDGRIRAIAYDGEQVYRLHGFVGYQIDIEFETGETFIGMGAGDIEGLSYSGQDNHLFLKPKAARVATNLTVLTSRRHYQFVYTAMAQRVKASDTDVIFALRFTYPTAASAAAQDAVARRIDSDLSSASAQRRQNVDYWYCGAPIIRPNTVTDDGIHTRFRFGAQQDLPAIFVRNDDDSETLLNYSMDGGDVIIHRVARRFVVRRGKLQGCIVNKGYAGGGVRLDSGTVTPEVQRRLQGAVP